MQDLVTELGGHVNVVTGPHNDSSPRVLLLMTLWWLGNHVVDAEEERIDDDNVQQPPPFEFTNDARINRINISNLL